MGLKPSERGNCTRNMNMAQGNANRVENIYVGFDIEKTEQDHDRFVRKAPSWDPQLSQNIRSHGSLLRAYARAKLAGGVKDFSCSATVERFHGVPCNILIRSREGHGNKLMGGSWVVASLAYPRLQKRI